MPDNGIGAVAPSWMSKGFAVMYNSIKTQINNCSMKCLKCTYLTLWMPLNYFFLSLGVVRTQRTPWFRPWMHCNLRPPVVLGFNYDGHTAPAYKFNNSPMDDNQINNNPQSVSIYQCFCKLLLRLCRNCYFRLLSNFWHITIRISDPYFLEESNGYPSEVGALFTTVSSIRVSRVGRVSSVRVTLTVTVTVSRVSIMVSVRDGVK